MNQKVKDYLVLFGVAGAIIAITGFSQDGNPISFGEAAWEAMMVAVAALAQEAAKPATVAGTVVNAVPYAPTAASTARSGPSPIKANQ